MIYQLTKTSYGTQFQQNVWKEITKIPFGSVRTYKEIACLIGNPQSSRAVANACAKNPYPIMLFYYPPSLRFCHLFIIKFKDWITISIIQNQLIYMNRFFLFTP